VSETFAELLAELFRLVRRPLVVMNCPPVEPLPERAPHAGRLRVIYQAAVGPGRRAEDVVEAAPHAGDAQITIRVVGADTRSLSRLIEARGVGDRVELSDPVPAATVVEALAPFDVGLIINRPVTRNDELAVPNKLFEYMMAGLAVVVPELPEMGELVGREQIGLTYPPGDTAAMGRAIRRLAEDPELLRRCRERGRRLAVETYNAESQVAALAEAWDLASWEAAT
jgi:glycosyltransferase involved in cell wall biosynthesis